MKIQDRKKQTATHLLDTLVDNAAEIVTGNLEEQVRTMALKMIDTVCQCGPSGVITVGQATRAFGRGRTWIQALIKNYGVTGKTVEGIVYYKFEDLVKARNEWFEKL